jgi:hypothetical protein
VRLLLLLNKKAAAAVFKAAGTWLLTSSNAWCEGAHQQVTQHQQHAAGA